MRSYEQQLVVFCVVAALLSCGAARRSHTTARVPRPSHMITMFNRSGAWCDQKRFTIVCCSRKRNIQMFPRGVEHNAALSSALLQLFNTYKSYILYVHTCTYIHIHIHIQYADSAVTCVLCEIPCVRELYDHRPYTAVAMDAGLLHARNGGHQPKWFTRTGEWDRTAFCVSIVNGLALAAGYVGRVERV